ncbi:RNA 2',3'-cyclic phosphodiesterase [Salibacter sp.]|uniref:RNA 2',3'-cyclic phosphodiesterase n=1 Tax=Salibacter sp. TaxID=2010995 RepID=UPI00286FC473|nr:RNA 2',3'-cyclic phosphodiesterase [Salibacter sp.]MDR9487488.1 RNA 2',3'-cyclic phosphodiesterase [Salibacter sp.]
MRWIPPANYHITLLFMGETGEQSVPEIKKAVESILNSTPPLPTLTFDSFKTVHGNKPKMIWAAYKHSKQWQTLRDNLYYAVIGKGKPDHVVFSPHVTMARVYDKKPIQCPDVSGEMDLTVEPNELILMQSLLKKEGAEYEPVHHFQLP